MSVLEHNGKPNLRQTAELIGYISNAITITVPTFGATVYSITGLSSYFSSFNEGLAVITSSILAVYGLWASFLSWKVVFFSLKGNNKINPIRISAIFAFGILLIGFGCAFGAILGSFII